MRAPQEAPRLPQGRAELAGEGNPGCESRDTSLDGEVATCHGALRWLTALLWTTWGRRGMCVSCRLVALPARCSQMFHSAFFPQSERRCERVHMRRRESKQGSGQCLKWHQLWPVCVEGSNPPSPTLRACISFLACAPFYT